MSLYKPKDVELLLEKWDSIMSDVEQQKLKLLEPTLEEMKEVHAIILSFLKTTKRKLYGGFALNLLVKSQNENDAIYKPDKIPDIDFYSPEPLIDLIKLCNILHEKGYKSVVGREAMHQETYSISVNYCTYCDISYVPRAIYDRMPFKEENGLMVIHPHFMIIDYLRMMTDPLISYWRFENDLKTFKRYVLLQKYFPFPTNTAPVDISGSTPELDSVLVTIFKFICDRKSVVVLGFYAYNYFLKESTMLENNKRDDIKILPIPYFEMVSAHYRDDCLELLELLKSNITINKDLINHTEYYPFFQFTGHSVDIYLGDDLIARVYNNNNKCVPYIDVPAIDFSDEKLKPLTDTKVRLGTFPFVMLYGMITIMKARTNKDNGTKDLYYNLVSHLIEMRNVYFMKTKKTFLDDSVFKEFVVNCVGDTMQPDRQRKLLIESRKKQNKRYTFIYEPADGIKEPESNYVFANSSGNFINNPRNLRLSADVKDSVVEDYDDEAEKKK
jgi:hypothetical protein